MTASGQSPRPTNPCRLALLAMLCLAACEQKDAESTMPATTDPPPVKILLATEPGGVHEAVDARVTARGYNRLMSPAAAEIARNMMQEFAGATDERKVEIATLLGSSSAPEVWPFLITQAGTGAPNVRLAVLDALAIHGGGDPSPAIRASLSSDDVEIRALAATLLGQSAKDPAAWSAAAVDPVPDVRVAYHAAIHEASADIQLHAARAALAAGDPQLRREGTAVAGRARTKEAADLLIPMLQDPAAGEIAAEGLFYFFGRFFENSAEALSWWQTHREQFTDDLLAK